MEIIGIRSELGRAEKLIFSQSAQPVEVYQAKNAYEARVGRVVSWDEFYTNNPDVRTQDGTSIFDPALCELAYRWFCPPSGLVFDPFAGGSVRGIVASRLGRQYVGIDLRAEQINANREQADAICADPFPVWQEGDSRHIRQICPDVEADFVFSCPPYADLEVYSDDPRDLSTLEYPEFLMFWFSARGIPR